MVIHCPQSQWPCAANTTARLGHTRLDTGPRPLVSDEMYNKQLIAWPVLWFIILPPGLLANVINIRTFLRMGLDDSVTISFFVLAISDFIHLLLPLGNIVAMTCMYLSRNYGLFFAIQPIAVFLYILNITAVFNNWTGYITTYLALQRCMCIVMPFRFKTMFTNARTWGVMVFLGLFSILPMAAILATFDIRRGSVPGNRTQYVFSLKPIHEFVQKYIIDVIFFAFINTACLVISCLSLIAMSYSLVASVKFRRNTALTKVKSGTGSTQLKGGKGDDEERFGSKERLAIVQVALLTTIYVVSNVPKLSLALGSAIEPEFGAAGVYKNLIMIMICPRSTFDLLNSAVNFLVYYKYNTRYRTLCFDKSPRVGGVHMDSTITL